MVSYNRLLVNRDNKKEIPWPVVSILEATFTVSPKRQKRGIWMPTTADTHGPVRKWHKLINMNAWIITVIIYYDHCCYIIIILYQLHYCRRNLLTDNFTDRVLDFKQIHCFATIDFFENFSIHCIFISNILDYIRKASLLFLFSKIIASDSSFL